MSVHTGSPKGGDAHGDGVPIVLKGSGECLRQEEGEQGRRPSFQKMARNAPGILWEQAGNWRAVCAETCKHGSGRGGEKRAARQRARRLLHYELRQAFIHEGKYLNYTEMDKRMQSHETYKALPAKVSQQVLRLLDKNWTAFFEARAAYNIDPSKFTGRPRLPKYKRKTEGRNLLIYTMQAISGGQTGGKKTLQRGIIKPSGLPIEIKTTQNPTTINQVRIVPKKGY